MFVSGSNDKHPTLADRLQEKLSDFGWRMI